MTQQPLILREDSPSYIQHKLNTLYKDGWRIRDGSVQLKSRGDVGLWFFCILEMPPVIEPDPINELRL